MYFDRDHLLERDRLELSRKVEEAISESDGRAFADWGSNESRYALMMRDIMKDILDFLDRYEEEIEGVVFNLNSEISERDAQIADNDKAFDKILDIARGRDEW